MTKTLTRREFLERSAAFSAGAAALSPLLSACRPSGREAGGAAQFTRAGAEFSLSNETLRARWTVDGGRFRPIEVASVFGPPPLRPLEAFALRFSDGRVVRASDLEVIGLPEPDVLDIERGAARLASRSRGRRVAVSLRDDASALTVRWQAILGDGAHYLRQEITLEAEGTPVPIAEIRLVDAPMPGAQVMGSVPGSPIVAGNWFVGFEYPLCRAVVEDGLAIAALDRELPVRPDATPRYSCVIGVARNGQLRRAFLAYLERERAHPYRPFLHYNSWYDIAYFGKYDEAAALAVIAAYGEELHTRRGVTLDSFLFDDGWDDPRSLWRFHQGFPNGFTPLRDAAARYGAAPGVWMSPWGGYGDPRTARVTYGREQGFETIEDRFALSGPRYFERFRETCLSMIREYGVNQFKFDGTGNANRVVPGSEFDSDFDAMIALIGDLRREKADLYVNLTTGTYPSPFFLRYADSIWRGGEDHGFAGVGTKRQQWITYRDADTYAGIVRKGPLFPLNALMLHGLIYARHAHDLDTDPAGDFGAEVRSYFGTGTQLQEMYVTPALLSTADWDALAEAANWSRAHAGVLADTHWVGGDPAALEPYGWAAWRDGAATLVLRNPKDVPQALVLDPAEAFQLPPSAAADYELRSPWAEDAARPPVRLTAGRTHEFRLEPFQVVTWSRT